MFNYFDFGGFVNFLFNDLSGPIIGLVGLLLSVWMASRLGFKGYRSQKIYENIDRVIFKNGIDQLIYDIEEIRLIIESNYSEAVYLLGYLEGLDDKVLIKNMLEKSMLGVVSKKIPGSVFIFIDNIGSSKSLDELFGALFANAGKINDFFNQELRFILNNFLDDTIPKDSSFSKMNRTELAEYLLKSSKANYQYFDKVMRIYKLLEILRKIGFRWRELNISTYSDLKKITEDRLSKQLLFDLEGLKLSDQNYFEFVNNYVKESKDQPVNRFERGVLRRFFLLKHSLGLCFCLYAVNIEYEYGS